MKLTILGQYGKYPNKDGSTCGYLIESKGGAKILLEMGSGTLRNLAKVCAYEHIDAVVLSHFHGDHISDAFVFRNIAFELTKTGVWDSYLPFFMPDKPVAEFLALSSAGIDVHTVTGGMRAEIKDIRLQFFEMNHTLPTFGVRVDDGEKCLAYTADTKYCENIKKLIEGADLALADACILSKHHTKDSPHISVYDIAELTKDIPKTVLTHLDAGNEAEILDEARSINNNAELAQELKTFQV